MMKLRIATGLGLLLFIRRSGRVSREPGPGWRGRRYTGGPSRQLRVEGQRIPYGLI